MRGLPPWLMSHGAQPIMIGWVAYVVEQAEHARLAQADHDPPGGGDHDRLRRCAGTALRAEGGSAPLHPR